MEEDNPFQTLLGHTTAGWGTDVFQHNNNFFRNHGEILQDLDRRQTETLARFRQAPVNPVANRDAKPKKKTNKDFLTEMKEENDKIKHSITTRKPGEELRETRHQAIF